MRCFEIIVEPADEDQNVGINNNMRCFEIINPPEISPDNSPINNNMRCFEMSYRTPGCLFPPR